MDLDLAKLGDMYTRLPADLALLPAGRAALGLQRNDHRSGVRIRLDLERVMRAAILGWPSTAFEEEFAKVLPASVAEGRIARRGAVRAALKAGDSDRANVIAAAYSSERGVPRSVTIELHKNAGRAR